MTMGKYERARKTSQGSILIKVSKHKTADTHGPASIVLTPTLYSFLNIYVHEVRSQVKSPESESNNDKSMEPVFVSWSGAKMGSGQISTAINAAWKKGGMEGHVTLTIFRKSNVFKVHKDKKEMKGELADLMGHKVPTAEKFYRLRKKEEACVEAANNLASIIRESKKAPMPESATSEIHVANDKESKNCFLLFTEHLTR